VPRRRKQEQEKAPAEAEFIIQLTPNQVVAYNLAQARLWKDWTQEEAAENLEPYLGSRWSKATFSAAERSVDGQRVRQFTADEIVAFARGFGLPVGFFFLPPPPGAAPLPIKLASPQSPWSGIPMAELVDVVFGPLGEIGFMAARVEEFFRQSSVDMQTDVQRRLRLHTEVVVEGVIKRDLDRFDDWRTMLVSLANQLEDWQIRSRRAATKERVDDG
jgi:hypothetical protein